MRSWERARLPQRIGAVGTSDRYRPERRSGADPCTVPSVVQVTGTLQKEAWDKNVLPPVEQVRPGLWSIPVPIPNNPLRYVLVYAIEPDGGGAAIVDAGWNTDEAWNTLNSGLAAAGFDRRRAVPSWSPTSTPTTTGWPAGSARRRGVDRPPSGRRRPAPGALRRHRRLLPRIGTLPHRIGRAGRELPDCNIASMMIVAGHLACPTSLRGRRAHRLPGWDLTTIWTPGHSPGHVCFYSEAQRLLLSGDHVLPRITPNISLHPQQFPNPLGRLPRVAPEDARTWTPTRSFPPTSTGSPTCRIGSRSSSSTTATAWRRSNRWWPTIRGRRPGRSPSSSSGPGRGTRSTTTCSARPTARPWPTASSWSSTTGFAGRATTRPASTASSRKSAPP